MTKPESEDVLALIGISSLCYGAWLVYEPAGFIVGGAFAVAVSVLKARSDQ